MKLHRFWHNHTQDSYQRRSQTSLGLRRGVLILLAFMVMGMAIAFAPGGKGVDHVNAPAGISHSLIAQGSPLSSPLSIALNTEAAARRTDPAVSEPDAGDQRNLLRVAAVIAGVLLVTVIVWRQR